MSGPFSGSQALASEFLQRVYIIMAGGLSITGVSAYLFAQMFTKNPALLNAIFGGPQMWLFMLLPLAFVLVLSYGIERLSYTAATLTFVGYSFVNGLVLSTVFLIYTAESITSTFFIAAGTFGAMALLAFTTKRDLSSWGSYLFMALIGLIIASVVNWFLHSSTLQWIISCAGVLIFCGLTAYDTQKILNLSREVDQHSENSKKLSLLGALTLYLDFINLFMYLLRLFGSRK